MPITTREARQLATVAEWPLVVSSLPAKIGALSPARLKARIERARKLRDKYADLVKRQHRRTQSKRSGQPNEKLNARTKRKAELFSEVLARYQAAAKGVKVSKSAKASKVSKGTSAKARKSATPGSGKAAKGKAAKGAKRRAAKAQASTGRTARTSAAGAKPAKASRAANVSREAVEASEAAARQAAEVAANAAAAQEAAASVAPPEKVKKTRAPFVPKSNVHIRTGQHRIHAHVSSRGRRRQGRRDSR